MVPKMCPARQELKYCLLFQNYSIALTRTRTKLLSEPGADAQNKRGDAERLRLLEDENSRLKLLVNNLITALEMWRSIAR